MRGHNGDYNQNRVFFSDFGATAKTAYTILQTGFTQAATVQIYDFDKQGTAATTKHVINAGENTGQSEFTLDGIRRDSATSSLWPYVGSEFGKEHLSCTPSRLMARTNRRASSFTVQLDNKVNGTFDTGSSRARLWLDGGTPFVDLDASVAAPYNFTGSNEAPTLGSQTGIYQWAGVMHEMIIFDRVLSTTEIDTVHKYLNTKWRLGFMEDTKSDKNGQFVYGVSSSNSSQDTWTYDATDAGFPGDTSAWELG